eukprot:4526282-Amphidinium_carterae.1
MEKSSMSRILLFWQMPKRGLRMKPSGKRSESAPKEYRPDTHPLLSLTSVSSQTLAETSASC